MQPSLDLVGHDAATHTTLNKRSETCKGAKVEPAARRFELQQTSAATSFYTALAGKKLVRFQEFAALYPEAVFVFVGDNGQVPKPSSLARRSRLHALPLAQLPSDSRPG